VDLFGVAFGFGENEAGQLADGTQVKLTRITEARVAGPTIAAGGRGSFSAFLCGELDPSCFVLNVDELVPDELACPYEKPEDMIEPNTAA